MMRGKPRARASRPAIALCATVRRAGAGGAGQQEAARQHRPGRRGGRCRRRSPAPSAGRARPGPGPRSGRSAASGDGGCRRRRGRATGRRPRCRRCRAAGLRRGTGTSSVVRRRRADGAAVPRRRGVREEDAQGLGCGLDRGCGRPARRLSSLLPCDLRPCRPACARPAGGCAERRPSGPAARAHASGRQGNRVNAPLLNAVHPAFVMPGLDPGIWTDTAARDGRVMPGHDGNGAAISTSGCSPDCPGRAGGLEAASGRRVACRSGRVEPTRARAESIRPLSAEERCGYAIRLPPRPTYCQPAPVLIASYSLPSPP